MPKFNFASLEKKAEVKHEKPELSEIIGEKSKKPKEPLDIVFKNMTITQDDLWFLLKLKTGVGVRIKKKILLPKFTELFIKELEKQNKKGVGK